jgi:hypothetical protein
MRGKFIFKSCVVLAICFLGCDENEKMVAPVEVLAISVDNSVITEFTEDWIIIYDDLGNVIEHKSVEGGDDIVVEMIESTPGMTLGVTFMRHFSQDDYHFYSLDTYLNIEKGETLKIAEFRTGVSGEFGGVFQVFVNGFTSLDQYALSNKFGFSCSSGAYSNAIDLTCQMFDPDNKYILQLSDNTGDLRYTVLESVKANDSYQVSFDDMQPFDKTIDFVFPQSSDVVLRVMGREAGESLLDNGYDLHSPGGSNARTQIKAGYLNSLTNYSTQLTVGYADFEYVYMNQGSIPQPNIKWPSKAGFNLSSKLIHNFSANVSSPFNWRVSSWEHQKLSSPTARVLWRIFSNSESHKLSELPAEILSKHPVLAFENLNHSSTTFYTESEPYIDKVKRTLNEEMSQMGVQVGLSIW